MTDDFRAKSTDVVSDIDDCGLLGVRRAVVVQTRAGVSELVSWVGMFDDGEEENLEMIPDRVLSDSLDHRLDDVIEGVAEQFRLSKYLPDGAWIRFTIGLPLQSDNRNVMLKDWEDFGIEAMTGDVLYDQQELNAAIEAGQDPLAWALYLIVHDICDDGLMLTEEWYCARILYEYYREAELSADSAFLIGTLYRELRVKLEFEDDLSKHYSKLRLDQENRQKGSERTKSKSEELRTYCVQLYVKMALEIGMSLHYASKDYQAKELKERAINERPNDFQRNGKPYRHEWFLRHIIEDRHLDIIDGIKTAEKLIKG